MEVTLEKHDYSGPLRRCAVVVGIGKKWITLTYASFRWRFERRKGWEAGAFTVYNFHPWMIVPADLAKLNALADANGGTWKPKKNPKA